jgi:ribosomal protein S18 acetylase RimI-like enzyme
MVEIAVAAERERGVIDIRPLTQVNPDDLRRLIVGYTAHHKYQVSKRESAHQITLTLELASLPVPYHKRYEETAAETAVRYGQVAALGFSFGAYEEETCVGIALAEPHHWNQSLWVWELHVAETHQGQGIGRRLVDALAEKGRTAGLRTLVCETQTTNAPAIRFYQQVGFTLEGIDLSYYTNDDFPAGEIAVFMKKRLG